MRYLINFLKIILSTMYNQDYFNKNITFFLFNKYSKLR